MNVNLGILAHVDAGKTSLTEQLLYAAGVIDEIGRVDKGNTQTDSLALERQRGITIKSAVVSFVVDDITVNLIDTPGHPDFIAEVERVLNVLDGAVLVVSAVEGVQAQTRVLMRTLQRLQLPTLIFVNKIDRGPAGEKVAYIRMFSGTIRIRDRLAFGQDREGKVTAINVFEHGTAVKRPTLEAGQIGKLWGLGDIQIGDTIGNPPRASASHHFAPPTLETVIVARHAADKAALHVALSQLAEQDPLIDLRQDDSQQELYVSLYGEVQKEVIQATLANDYSLEAAFRETTPICVEKPVGTGSAVETLAESPNPFLATIGLCIEPAPSNTGIDFQMDVDVRTIPFFIYNSVENFHRALENTVNETLHQGLYGWQVTDCKVTLTQSGYVSPGSTPADFRKLLPLVLMRALTEATTQVCEPLQRFQLEIPADTIGPTLGALARVEAVLQTQEMRGSSCLLQGEIPVARTHELQHLLLPNLTRGEGVLESSFSRFEAMRGSFPSRSRFGPDPRNRKAYLMQVLGWSSAKGQDG